jgi:hypothetical protein
LHKVLNDAVDNKLITENPARRAEAPRTQGKKYKTRVRPFTKDEALLLVRWAQDAIRDSEIYPIWRDLNVPECGRCRRRDSRPGDKTAAGTRVLRIPAGLVALLRERRARVLAFF